MRRYNVIVTTAPLLSRSCIECRLNILFISLYSLTFPIFRRRLSLLLTTINYFFLTRREDGSNDFIFFMINGKIA